MSDALPHLHLRILVAVDERGLARPAIERGLELALRHGDLAAPLSTKLRLVHAVRVPSPLWPGTGTPPPCAWPAMILRAPTRCSTRCAAAFWWKA